ncbi:MAG: methylmalonyl Co-A mutase-associated GTPase MeaB [Leptospira sp.]|nr:methylmalonyl Co-A mutase-associated GTPase MeaB [Leptospira sp.]
MKESALSVKAGVSGVSSLNPDLLGQISRKKKSKLSMKDYVEGILNGDRLILSKAITLVESNRRDHHDLSQEILEQLLPHIGRSVRIGITGVPGVGKSTFIEAFGEHIIGQGHKLAVLAIDPTSQRSHGSILGDKTRMETLSVNPKAYIRPSPAGGSLGGVARKTRESIFLCEAAGFDTIIIETVGVGQSETAVHSMVDFFLLLMLAGAGDELQGIKRGIMEMADMIAINKADGDNYHKATGAKSEYEAALHLFPPTPSGWTPKVATCSSTENTGIDEVWNRIHEYINLTKENGFLLRNRKEQTRFWFREFLAEAIQEDFYSKPGRREKAKLLEERVVQGEITSLPAIRELLE